MYFPCEEIPFEQLQLENGFLLLISFAKMRDEASLQ